MDMDPDCGDWKGLTGWLVRRLVPDFRQVENPAVRHAYVRLECWVSIIGNLFQGGMKLVLGLMSGSIALTADAVHTFGDMVSSMILLVSMRVAALPPDPKHPYGHGRAEALGTMALAILLIVTAVEFADIAFHRLAGENGPGAGSMQDFGWFVIPMMLVFWWFKEWMARFSLKLGRRIGSDGLVGDAQHHRSDALTNLIVVASFVGARFQMTWLDGVFGLAVAGFIGWAGIYLAWNMVSRLMGEAPSDDMVTRILAAAGSVRGVRGVHGVQVHDYGNHKVVSLHVEVAGALHTDESHRVATLVEDSVFRRLGYSAVVHMEVKSTSGHEDRTAVVEAILKDLVEREPDVMGFHAIHVTASDRQLAVDLHLTVTPGLAVESCHRIEHELTEQMMQRMGTVKVNVHCEPDRKTGRTAS